MTKQLLLPILALILAMLACSYGPPTTPNDPTPTITPTEYPTNALGLVTVGNVYVRDDPNGIPVGYLYSGVRINNAVCSGDWCYISVGCIWRGCTSDNPNGLGCSEAQ